MLTNQRKEYGYEITFERHPWDYALVNWFSCGQQNTDCYLEPGTLGTLAGVVKPRQLSRMEGAFEPWLRDKFDQPYSFDSTGMLAWETFESIFYMSDCVLWQFLLVVILNSNGHYSRSSFLLNIYEEET